MQALDAILEFLRDGQWHSITEVSTQKELGKLSMANLNEALNFLAEYGFIELTHMVFENGVPIIKAKLTPQVQQFFRENL